MAQAPMREAIVVPDKMERQIAVRAVKGKIFESLGESYAERKGEVYEILGDIQKTVSRDLILKENRRMDNRAFDEVRPIACDVGILPRTPTAVPFSPVGRPRSSVC